MIKSSFSIDIVPCMISLYLNNQSIIYNIIMIEKYNKYSAWINKQPTYWYRYYY